ncbi:hypothetical protein CPB85DRAFT_1307346 [Mucidula mucida]|nr:hypothetical protein CPB85DRAFT_1307346 [Mucidula mucida]
MYANKDRAAQDQQITWPGDGRVTSVNEAFDRLFEMTPEKLMPEEYFMPDENLNWGDFAHMLTTTHDNILAIENFKLACNSLFEMNENATPMDPQVQVPMLLQDESMIVPYLLPVTTAWLSWEDTALGYSLNVPSMVQPYLADVFQKVSSLYGNTTFNDMQKAMQTFFAIDVFRQFLDLRDSEYMLFGDFERESSEECQCA